jgi:hypothetical protein
MDGILDKDIYPKNIFTGIKTDNISMGAMYSAILGVTQNDNNKPRVHEMTANNFNTPKTILKYFVDSVVNGKYDAIIDTGAFLRNISSKDVIDSIIAADNNHQTYIYIVDGIQIKIIKSDDKSLHPLFIYYDQRHTIGIDVKQPYVMKGLVTVNYFNKFTDISQGIYRLRKMNYGHVVDFVFANISKKIVSSEELLNHLIAVDSKYKSDTESFALLQQIKYIKRKIVSEPRIAYLDETFYEPSYIKTDDDVGKNLYRQYINEKFCNDDNKIIKMLCSKIKNININLEQTQTNIEEQISVAENVSANIQSQMSRSIQISDFGSQININNDYEWEIDAYLQSKYSKNIFSTGNYIKYTDDNLHIMWKQCFEDLGVFASPSIFSDHFDILHTRENVISNDLISSYNYYAIVMEDISIIIKGWEYVMLKHYFEENDIPPKYTICDKNNIVVFGNKNNMAIFGKKNIFFNYFIKYLMGGTLSIIDVFMVSKYIITHQKPSMITKLLEMLEYTFIAPHANDSVSKLLRMEITQKIDFKSHDEFIVNYFKTNKNQFIRKIFDVEKIDKNLIEETINLYKSINNILTGGGKYYWEKKYLKYKYKYANLKKNVK